MVTSGLRWPLSKVAPGHLRRDAYLYVRQSSVYQVAHNTESSRRQYDLRARAVALGWPAERVIVIDVDQGHSGASAADREGFQRLVAEVSLGKAGIVLGLECSRLARNNADWHRLLQLCSLTNTLICDEDGCARTCRPPRSTGATRWSCSPRSGPRRRLGVSRAQRCPTPAESLPLTSVRCRSTTLSKG